MTIRRPGIPAIDQTMDPKIRQAVMALKENAEIANGTRGGTGPNEAGWKRRSVTLGMLIKYGVVTEQVARQMFEED